MLKTHGFVDLRVGHGAAGIGDESVWPSFTDIMTVIVMIFLMTLVVIMVRNFGLSSELLTNISAREAAMLANQGLAQKNTELQASLQTTESERSSLAISLAQALDRITSLTESEIELQADIVSMNEARQELEQLNERLQQARLESLQEVESLTAETQGLTRQKAELEVALQDTQSALQGTEATLQGAQATLQSTEAERSSLSESLERTLERVAMLGESERELQAEVTSLTTTREELLQANQRLQQAQLESLQEVESLTAETQDLTRQKADLEVALQDARAALQDTQATLQSAQATLQSAEAERSSLSESLERALERVALLGESERELQAQVTSLTETREELLQANERLQQAQLENLQEVESLTAETQDLARQKADLEVALQDIQVALQGTEATLQGAQATLQSTEAERSSLSESLAQALDRVALLGESERELQDELARMTANELLLTRNIASLDETLTRLQIQSEEEISSLVQETTTLEDRIYTLSEQLEHLKRLLERSTLENQLLTTEMAQVERINESAAERYTRVADEVISLKQLIEQREREIAFLQTSADASAQQYRSLQEEYDSLDAQYRKLIRPARSPAGKTVTEIRVEKISGALSYELKQPDAAEWVSVSRDQLGSILESLKNRLGESLYTKIIIPDDSNLTFNEAWGFTWEILRKYDYYYQ